MWPYHNDERKNVFKHSLDVMPPIGRGNSLVHKERGRKAAQKAKQIRKLCRAKGDYGAAIFIYRAKVRVA